MPFYTKRHRWFDIIRKQYATTMWPFKGLPIRYLEIGCFEGMSAVWMMTNVLTHPDSRCVIVDPWSAVYAKRVDWEAVERNARQNLSPWQDRVTIIKGKWPESKPQVQGTFDAVYIDAVHEAGPVYNDSIAAWPILKPGGIMLWDDWRNDVEIGVAKFLREIDGCYQAVSKQMQLHIRKVSETPLVWTQLRS